MGTLGSYLSSAREKRGIDLHDAAQQTRISINYLRAMEQEDFSKLPGEVFLRGFLKSYARFLGLDEAEVMKRYQELRPVKKVQTAVPERQQETQVNASGMPARMTIPVEPVLWGAVIFISLTVLLFVSLPEVAEHAPTTAAPPAAEKSHAGEGTARPQRPEMLYLEMVALEDTWILVRTDASPQKKAVLKKGESVIWSADERYLLSYGSASSVRLLLNGSELTVNAPKNAVVRDLVVTRNGIAVQRVQTEQAKPARPKPQLQPRPQPQQPAEQPQTTTPSPPPVAAPSQQTETAPPPAETVTPLISPSQP